MRALLLLSFVCALTTGCAAINPAAGCVSGETMSSFPATATADHSSAAPANQQHFQTGLAPTATGVGCAVAEHEVVIFPSWTNPDPLDISIDNSSTPTNGTATCTSSTSGPVTLVATATFSEKTYTSTVQLTCK